MIVIAGKNNIAVHTLNLLKFKYNIKNLAVVINKTESGNNTWQYSLKKRATEINVPIISLEEAEKNASIFLSLEFDQLVKIERFNTRKIFNIHFSLLPKYKGMYTSIWPILNNEISTGVSLHYIDNGIDTGEIIDQITINIDEKYTSKDIYLNYISHACTLIENNIKNIIEKNHIPSKPQESKYSSYYSKKTLTFSSEMINFNKTAWEIGRYIRAFSFRNYQLPHYQDINYCNYEITSIRSSNKPGILINDNENSSEFSTIDYNIILYKDKIDILFDFCKQNNLYKIKKHINNISSIDERNQNSWSLLMVACYYGYLDIVKYLIDSGANINATNYKGTSVLMYAKEYTLRSEDKKIIDLLIEKGANILVKDMHYKCLTEYLTEDERIKFGI
ncbi:formyltransferase family protein [Photorhabdus khanii]|uniref:Formyl transferase n=1 Tax=Photorhabdus khanii subsp. guanajuatensis TaxID=2100166 RepID=A0A4R4K091_9GAMM|nr:formyltransferase family protein [Photorhabdus khanii]TDB60660.1 formyl transferase [Photorhabdus khanii subsp. guanajuatensis]